MALAHLWPYSAIHVHRSSWQELFCAARGLVTVLQTLGAETIQNTRYIDQAESDLWEGRIGKAGVGLQDTINALDKKLVRYLGSKLG